MLRVFEANQPSVAVVEAQERHPLMVVKPHLVDNST